ncbi:MAG: hypothetical protein C4B56_00495 [Candidatus Methanophagaceae archaeon]|nr:MAG: hypothetical protein C4B56_00495 [Methanophagales archaeon]
MTGFLLLCFGHESMRESGKRKRNRVYQIDHEIPGKLFKNTCGFMARSFADCRLPMSDPVGVGHLRRPHNCGYCYCDTAVKEAIKEFNLTHEI